MKERVDKLMDSKVTQIVLIVSIVVGVQNYFFSPTERLQSQLTALEAKVETTTTVSAEIQNLKDNHIHSIETDVSVLKQDNLDIKVSLAKLETILNERLPAKK